MDIRTKLLTILRALEGRELNTSTIASFVEMPEQQVRNNLHQLQQQKKVKHNYVFDRWGAVMTTD